MELNIVYLVLSVFAVWRITHLFSKEDGPFDMIYAIRKKAGAGFFGKLLDCFYCCSVWIALPFGIWLGNSVAEKLLCWAAISGAACLMEQATMKHENKNNNETDYNED